MLNPYKIKGEDYVYADPNYQRDVFQFMNREQLRKWIYQMQDIAVNEDPISWKNRVLDDIADFREHNLFPLIAKNYLLARKRVFIPCDKKNIVNHDFDIPPTGLRTFDDSSEFCEPGLCGICYKCNELIYFEKQDDPSNLSMHKYHDLMQEHQKKCIAVSVLQSLPNYNTQSDNYLIASKL